MQNLSTPKFLFFDLGRVLLHFSMERMCCQMGEVAGVSADRVREIIFGLGLQHQYERGQITPEELYELFCGETGTRPEPEALFLANNDIFEVNQSMATVVSALSGARWPLGILSNTCPSHWDYCRRRYTILDGLFRVHIVSYEVRATKPDAEIFQAAARAAGHEPGELFFVDDMAENVEGARAAGLDAVQYTTTPRLVADLRARGVCFNY